MGVKSRLKKRFQKYLQWSFIKRGLILTCLCVSVSFLTVYLLSALSTARMEANQNRDVDRLNHFIQEASKNDPNLKSSSERLKEYLKGREQSEQKKLKKMLNLETKQSP